METDDDFGYRRGGETRQLSGQAADEQYAYAINGGQASITASLHAVDAVGNRGPVALFRLTKDVAPPVSTASAPALVNTPLISVSWTASDALSGVASAALWYRYNAENWTKSALNQNGTAGTFRLLPPRGDGRYDIAVRAVDRVGNLEALPAAPHTTVIYDTTPPTATIAVPATVFTVSNFIVSWNGSDATSGVQTYDIDYLVDGGDWQDWLVENQAGTATFNAPSGVYRFRARVIDYAGNVTVAETNEITVDLDAPTVTIVVPAGRLTSTPFNVRWWGDATDIAAYEVQYQNVFSTVWRTWLGNTLQTSAEFSGKGGEVYRFRVRAIDRAGNVGDWAQSDLVSAKRVTKYYLHGSSRVAMRKDGDVYYLHNDHLGSIALTTDNTGNAVSQARYNPYGSERWHSGFAPTDYTFTAQRLDSFGLLDYHARYYDATLGRFISPDSVVPDYANPQDLNRYSYVRGNPVRFTDPSGHALECGGGIDECNSHQYTNPSGNYASPAQVDAAVETAGTVVEIGAIAATAAVAGEYFGAETIKDTAIWAARKMATKQFMLRAGVSGTAGVVGDMIGQKASVGSYDWRRIPGVFVPNALGGGWLGEGYDVLQGGNLAMRAARISAAGATNILVSGAQRRFVGEENSLNMAESDLVIGAVSGSTGEVISPLLATRTKWNGTVVESVSSFFTHTNFLSAAKQWFETVF